MFRAQSIALYKNRPALVTETREKIEIRLEDGSTLRVREKDLLPLHPGPVSSLPQPATGGDFETARRMLAPADDSSESGGPSAWGELAELVFGAAGPAEVMACWKVALDGRLFRLEEGRPLALSDLARNREEERRARKEGEAAERAAFLDRAKKAKAGKAPAGSPFLPGDERFLGEIEALARGRNSKSKLCLELGLAETPEAAHAFLLATAVWADRDNPHALRAGCPLGSPRISLEPAPRTGEKGSPDLARHVLPALKAWAIDNAWSHDPDDAVSWDGSSAWIHVADPASLILPDSEAEREALARGATLYLPELTAPMLPDEALERFGLGLSASSPALSFRIGVDAEGAVSEVEVLATTLRVQRLSYGEADALIDSGGVPELAALASLADLRRERRLAQGAIEIDLPEVRVHVEREGPEAGAIKVESLPHYRSSDLVRELMLLAGEAVARWAFERSLPFPYYGQESPGEVGAAAEGDSLSAQFARRRLMRAGLSGPTPSAHRGLGLPFYAQVTSPLRRYQDLLAHLQLRALLEGRECLDADEVGRRCALAQAASAATRQAERASTLHWTLAYLSRLGAWSGEGCIVGSAGPGSWQVYIPSLGLETKLKLGSGRELDEPLTLRLVRVDLARLECSFDEERSY